MLATSVIERSALMGCDREITPCCGSSGVTIVAPGASARVGFGGRLIQAAVGSVSGRGGAAVVDVGRREIAEAAVMVRVVVPREQIAADAARVFERAEPVRKLGAVLQGPELRFRERIVVAHARPRMTGVDAQVREEQRDELAPHGRAAVGMDRELLRGDALFQAGRRNQAFRQVRILVAGDHPAHDVAAEEVEDHIERVVEVRDRGRTRPSTGLKNGRLHGGGVSGERYQSHPVCHLPLLRVAEKRRRDAYAGLPGCRPVVGWHGITDPLRRGSGGQHLALALRRARPGTSLHLIVDSTGLSIVGEGAWAAATHGGRGRRGWRKLHLGVDGSRVIVACALTEPTADDAIPGISLVDEVDGHLTRVTADPASDTLAFYGAAGARGARVVVPPTKTASLSRRGARSGARDRTIRRVKALGRRRWKKASGSHQHARVENAFFRYKSIVGDLNRTGFLGDRIR